MPARTLTLPTLRPALVVGGMMSTVTAMVLWTAVLVREWPRLMATGAICGADEGVFGIFGHCAACYPAAAATIIALGCAADLLADGRKRTRR